VFAKPQAACHLREARRWSKHAPKLEQGKPWFGREARRTNAGRLCVLVSARGPLLNHRARLCNTTERFQSANAVVRAARLLPNRARSFGSVASPQPGLRCCNPAGQPSKTSGRLTSLKRANIITLEEQIGRATCRVGSLHWQPARDREPRCQISRATGIAERFFGCGTENHLRHASGTAASGNRPTRIVVPAI